MSTTYEETEVASYAEGKDAAPVGTVKDPSAVRWYFNPAARIDVRDRVIGNEAPGQSRGYIAPATLIPFRDVTQYVPRPKDQPPPPGSSPRVQSLLQKTKFAWEIADEMNSAYADTGAMVIESLTGIEDDNLVRSIFRLCVGGKIAVAVDPMLPGQKIPVIPAMLDFLYNTAPNGIEQAFANKKDRKDLTLRATIEETRRILIISCEAAMATWARFTTDLSKQELSDRGSGGKGKAQFDVRDRRMFAAMGQPIETNIQANPIAKAVELLTERSLKEVGPDPRIASLEAIVAQQTAAIDKLMKKLDKPKSEKEESAAA